MVSANLVAAIVTLVPAMGLVWYYLHRYEGHFEQNRLFFGLMVGLFAGIGVRFLEVWLFPFDRPELLEGSTDLSSGTLVYSFFYTAIGLGLLESLGKTAVLGVRKFRERKETPFYGVAVGTGFGAMWVLQLLSTPDRGFVRLESGELATAALALYLDLFRFLAGVGLILSHAASAVWIGRGASQGRLWKGVMHGTLWLAPGLGIYWFGAIIGWEGPVSLVSLAWGIFAMSFADRRVLEPIVPQELRDMARRERRRKVRRGEA